VVGEFSASITSFERYGFVFDTFTHELDALSGKQALFLDINNSGRITGRVENGAGFHAFIFDGTLHDLGALGFAESVGIGLSETGYVTGSFGTLRLSASRPFLYDGTMHDLGSLGGSKGYGSDVNEYGEVAGSSAPVGAEPFHAFLYDGVMHDLGTLGGSSSEGFGINSSSIVVGASLLSNGESHGFVYSRDEGMIDLNLMIDNTSGWVLTDARAINDRGQVVGRGLIGGETHAYLLTPVPEPATACLIMGCLLGLGHYRSARAKRGLRSGSQAERLGELLSAAT
jgi:probable HAF family extracellular repeat protein